MICSVSGRVVVVVAMVESEGGCRGIEGRGGGDDYVVDSGCYCKVGMEAEEATLLALTGILSVLMSRSEG